MYLSCYYQSELEYLSKTTDADDPNIHAALERTPLLERRVHRDSRAEDGAGSLQRVALGDLENANIFQNHLSSQ